MTDFRERYKRLGFDAEANRALRSQRRDEARRGFRDEQMSLRREMGNADNANDSYSLEEKTTTASTQESGLNGCWQDSASCTSVDSHGDPKAKATADYEAAVQQRWERLQKWREEKNKRKQIEKKKAKPVFKVGVVHHRVYSPPVNKEPASLPPSKLCKSTSANMLPTVPKRVTRATEKRLAVKTLVSQQQRENVRSKKKAQPQIHDPMNEDKKMEIAPKDHMFRAPMGVTPMPIFGRQALEATRESIQAEINSFQIPATVGGGAFSESFNESAMSLKLSSDDQEMLDESQTNDARSPVSRHSPKNLSPPAADEAKVDGATPTDQMLMEVEHFSTTAKRNASCSAPADDLQKVLGSPVKVAPVNQGSVSSERSSETPTLRQRKQPIAEVPKVAAVDSPRRTRSTTAAADKHRIAKIVSTDSADSGIEPSLARDEPSFNGRRSITVAPSAGADSETDPTPTPDKNGKPATSRRKSSKADSSESAASPPKKSVNKRRSSRLIASESTNSHEYTFSKPAASTRRSTRSARETVTASSGNVVTIADVHQSALANQEPNILIKSPPRRKSIRFTTSGQENVNLDNTNLMEFSFSVPAMPPKLVEAPKSLLDDTVANLTPRRSSRLPQITTTGTPKNDEPLIRFSSFYVPTPTINESSCSEPTKQRSPNDVMNLSLNMSLPKESKEEKPPAFFSPYIVQSRGKISAMKEMKKRRFSQSGAESEDVPTKDNIMQKLNISVEEEERTAQYYKLILNQEIERLNELCERWNAIKESPETPDESRYIIQAAYGQTQLLINKKFERFRGLVQDCETGRGEMLVTCKDLQGFWDMMYMEINDCDNRFNKLEEIKANNWVAMEDEAAVKDVGKKKKRPPVKKPVSKKPAVGKPSSLRAMIAAARKKKAEADGVESNEAPTMESVETPLEEPRNSESAPNPLKTNSRRSASTPKSASRWGNLLKKVQLSQKRKATTSPLVVMKLSQMVKTPEVQLDESIVYINSGRTPAKSILKKDEVMGSVSKSTNKVFFREQSNEVKEFESRNSFVEESMSLDDIEEAKEPLERKLNFEDDSFAENAEEKDKLFETMSSDSHYISNLKAGSPKNLKFASLSMSPTISMSPLCLEDKESTSAKKKSNKLKKQISFKEDADEIQSRSFRTKKFSAPPTPIPKRRNQENIEENISTKMNDDAAEDNDDTPRQQLVKEIYLNEQGVVCERFVQVEKDRSNIKRSNSQSDRSSKTLAFDKLKNTQATPRLRRQNVNIPEIHITTPKTELKKLSSESKSSNSCSKRQSLKRSFADTTLTQDNVDISIEETAASKLSRKMPETLKSKSESKKSSTQSSEIQRTRSLKVSNSEELNIKQVASPKLRRTKSLNTKKVDVEDSPKEALKRKSLKKLQENIEPNEQETDRSTNEKVRKTPSFKRKNSKKILEIIDPGEKLTDVNGTVSDAVTPNTRRKSFRITRASVRDGN